MRQQAALHPRLAGHSPRGPFKHYWGEHARCAGDDIPYSLFLALGVPFEVTDQLAPEGWTFLCDADARGLDARAARPGACVVRPGARPEAAGVMPVQESLEALFAFRRGILPRLRGVPFVEEEWPVVCAWYPAARAVLLWNLAERARRLTVRLGDAARAVDVDGLGVALLTDVG
jgi:hypothetical protein